eukprot:CAMPEP_0185515164 /NCGR_PEP_ID=MMETSP1366-20130426/61803_1 /TAXON_ID=38817 /ORGANISM="Gephyrocapsa oceanica, Strain RCC1303" /LENGTH=241 /DNA_ID=CAMNT_0028125999 /DNA_START=184 /DNA_END=906 /DNA_ORIENTATION=-
MRRSVLSSRASTVAGRALSGAAPTCALQPLVGCGREVLRQCVPAISAADTRGDAACGPMAASARGSTAVAADPLAGSGLSGGKSRGDVVADACMHGFMHGRMHRGVWTERGGATARTVKLAFLSARMHARENRHPQRHAAVLLLQRLKRKAMELANPPDRPWNHRDELIKAENDDVDIADGYCDWLDASTGREEVDDEDGYDWAGAWAAAATTLVRRCVVRRYWARSKGADSDSDDSLDDS